MTQPIANCPNCGAKIVFQWPSSVQSVCTYCKSILVRSDVDIKKVGQVADLPADSSPIQLNTEGIYATKPSSLRAAFSTSTSKADGTSGTSL